MTSLSFETVHPSLGAQSGGRSSVRHVDTVDGLADIYEDGISVVALARPVAASLASEAHAAVAQGTTRLRHVLRPSESLQETLEGLEAFPLLTAEVHFWAKVITDLTGCEEVGVRVERLDRAMCPRFHVDNITLRAVVTVLGQGTEFLANEDVDRRWLGHRAQGVPDAESGLLLPGSHIRAAKVGDVVLLKGGRWPNNAEGGAVHRSPAASAEKPRLVVTFDPM